MGRCVRVYSCGRLTRSVGLWHGLVAAVVMALPQLAAAQPASTDGGVTPSPSQADADARLPWHDTALAWTHSATASTLGLGEDVQSRNPTYEMGFRFLPRYYLVDTVERSLSLRADISLFREFTNSDYTTRRGEWDMSDLEVWPALVENLHADPANKTDLTLRLPLLRFPTSKAAYSTGRILGLGAGIGLDRRVPLAGEGAALFASALLRPRVTYVYQFSEATVATSDAVDRVRVTPSGQSLPSDQLTGSALTEHGLTVGARAELDVTEGLGLGLELGAFYGRNHDLADRTRICGVVDTGCVDVLESPDAPRWTFATAFGAELSYELNRGVTLSVGYTNLTSQLGRDGRRRSVFYSPDARINGHVVLTLDALYGYATGKGEASASGSSASRPQRF